MGSEATLYQGEDKTIIVTTNTSLVSATEIEFIIDMPTQVKKTLSASQISAVTATQFSVQIDAADTETQAAGEYLMQARATISTKKTNGKFQPNKLTLKDSAFTDEGSGNDYN